MKFLPLLLCILLSSCSLFRKKNEVSTELDSTKINFRYSDNQGELPYSRQVLVEENKHKLSTMIKIMDSGKKGTEVIEKTIAVSETGSLKKNKISRNILRPSISQHSVWLEGKKYFSQIKVRAVSRELEVTLESPENKWNGTSTIPLPKSMSLFCFFTQIPECLKFSNVLFELKNNPKSSSKIGIIWESYPYMGEQWENVPTEIISFGRIFYDGVNESGDYKYNLEFNGQMTIYHFDKKFELKKFLWVAQGISIIR
ncbi:MAG: hypothetical protein ACOYL6_03285 [Bacteriovoracaceae bacterium]